MRHRYRLGFVQAVAGLLLLGVGFFGAWYVLRLQQQNSGVLNTNVASIRAAEELELIVREMRHDLDRYLLTDEREHLMFAVQKQNDVNDWLAKALVLSSTDKEKSLVASIQNGLDDYFVQLHELVDDPDKQISSSWVAQLEQETLSDQVLVAAHLYLDANEKKLEQSNEQNQSMAHKLSLAMVLLGVCGAVVGLQAGYGVARAINRSMFLLSIPIRDVAGKLETVVGPVEMSADPSVQDLRTVLETVSSRVGTVVEQLNQRHNEVIRANQFAAVGKLGAGLAHELRNPLMCMKTLVQSARRGKEAARLNADDLAVLDEEITRMNSLLQTFLDFARPSKLQSTSVELTSIVRKTLDFVTSRADARDITIERSLPTESLMVQGDATKLRQVILNLLLNACDAVPNGGLISVKLESDDSDPPSVCLSVADNGCGLPDEPKRIYEPFFSTKELGLGLGLPISKRIVEDHGGKLQAAKNHNSGSVFTVELPGTSQTGNKCAQTANH